MIHDGARPFLPGFSSINLSRKENSDEAEEDETIIEVQTPQVFPAKELWESYELAKLDNWQAVDTTECVSKYLGMEAMIIPGDPRNMKVTYIEDIFELEKLIEE